MDQITTSIEERLSNDSSFIKEVVLFDPRNFHKARYYIFFRVIEYCPILRIKYII